MGQGFEPKPWTVGEDNTVKAAFAEQWTDEEVGELLGRSALSVRDRRMALGLMRKNCAWWRQDNVLEQIRALADQGYTAARLAEYFGKARSSIYEAATTAGIVLPKEDRTASPDFQISQKVRPQVVTPDGRPIFARFKADLFRADEDEAPITLEQLQRTPSACAWPYDADDGTVVYCGQPGTRRGPAKSCYCDEHHAIALTPRRPKEERAHAVA